MIEENLNKCVGCECILEQKDFNSNSLRYCKRCFENKIEDTTQDTKATEVLIKCWNCEKEHNESDLLSNGLGNMICQNCFDENYYYCDDCSSITEISEKNEIKDEDKNICNRCFNRHYFTCHDCSEIFNKDDCYTWGNNRYCSDCINEFTGCCDNCGERINRDDARGEDGFYCEGCFEETEKPNEIKLPFKKIKSISYKKNPFKNYCGVELETINDNLKEQAFNTIEQLDKYGFSQVYDGSLGDNGLEFVSLAFNGDEFLNKIKDFCEELKNREFKINSDCGFHLHIGIKPELEELKKIFYFYHKYEEFFFKMASESRQNNHYCRKLNKLFVGDYMNQLKEIKTILDFQKMLYETEYKRTIDNYKHEKYYQKRYFWINFHSVFYRRTLEIRLHNGTIDTKKVNNWALIHLKVLDLLKKMNLETINLFPNTQEFFLSLFGLDIQNYIKERWAKFEGIKDKTDKTGESEGDL